MQNERDMNVWDQKKYNYSDKNADLELYKYYKNIDKVVEQNNVNMIIFKVCHLPN